MICQQKEIVKYVIKTHICRRKIWIKRTKEEAEIVLEKQVPDYIKELVMIKKLFMNFVHLWKNMIGTMKKITINTFQ